MLKRLYGVIRTAFTLKPLEARESSISAWLDSAMDIATYRLNWPNCTFSAKFKVWWWLAGQQIDKHQYEEKTNFNY